MKNDFNLVLFQLPISYINYLKLQNYKKRQVIFGKTVTETTEP